MRGSADLDLLATFLKLLMHTYRLSSLSGVFHGEGKWDQLDELHLGITHEK